jgi:radical SAM protein with 4Fe4S-binding SPASM domain
MLLSTFFKESRLPCELDKIETYACYRKLEIDPQEKIGLAKDLWIVPLNEGFVLCAKDKPRNVILWVDNINILRHLDDTHTFSELITERDGLPALEQLHYYNLLSFGSNKGRLREAKIDSKYKERYRENGFVIFSMVPLAVELNITNTCNFNCIHCSKDAKPIKFSDELSTKEILSIIDECAEVGVPELRFMGGEPLIHPGFLEFVKHAKEKGIFELRMSTNGWLIDERMAEELSKYFERIQISVHGASPEVHDRIVGKKGAFEQAKRAIALLNKNGVKVSIGFTVIRENVEDVLKMPDLALEWEVESLGFLCLIPQGRGARLKTWSVEEILEIGDKIKELQCKFSSCLNLEVAGFPPLNPIKNDAFVYGCEAGKTLMTIEPNGKIKACGILSHALPLQKREKTLLEIWHSPEFVQMRRQPDCEDCNYRKICWGPCQFLEKEMGL